MKKLLNLALLLLFWVSPLLIAAQVASVSPINQAEANQEQARQLWEQAIAAKGGRDKLHRLTNVQTSTEGQYVTHKGKKNIVRREELLVLPDKIWSWEDYGSDVFGLRVEMSNYAARIRYILTKSTPYEELRHLSAAHTWQEFGLQAEQAVGLMETAWVKPVPLAAWMDTFLGQKVDVVKTQVGKKRYDFAFDPKTHLLVAVGFYYLNPQTGLEQSGSIHGFSDYVSVNGIQMPQKAAVYSDAVSLREVTKSSKSVIYVTQTRFDVEYDESIFTTQTKIADGPTAWQKKPVKP